MGGDGCDDDDDDEDNTDDDYDDDNDDASAVSFSVPAAVVFGNAFAVPSTDDAVDIYPDIFFIN